jgi:hypothetical protein
MDLTMSTLIQVAIGAVVVLLLTLELGREVVLWYWRVNDIVRLLESIDASLKCLPAVEQRRGARCSSAG